MSKIFEGLQRAGTERANEIVERIAKERADAAPVEAEAAVSAELTAPPAPPAARFARSIARLNGGTQLAEPPRDVGANHALPVPVVRLPVAAADAGQQRRDRNLGDGRQAAHIAPAAVESGPAAGAEPAPISRFSRMVSVRPTGGALAAVADARMSEQYRIIRTKVVQHPAQPRRIVISSAGSGDGKTVTSANLAWTLALRTGENVLLVDGDFRHSSVAALYGIPNGPGLADVLAREATIEDAVVRVEQLPNLCILPCGTSRANPAELLDSARWRALAADFREWFRFTVFDAPPAGAVADYDLIQAVSDGVILIVRPDHSERRACLKAIDATPKERLVGIVLNSLEDWFLWKSPNAYYYAPNKQKR